MSTASSDIRIVIIEDDETIRESYAYLINETDGYSVVNTYSSAENALKSIKVDDPHIILLDVELPGISGLEAIPKIKAQVEDIYIIMLTVYDHQQTVFDALGKGAAGYLTKSTPPAKIIEALGEVMEGGGPMSANIARMVVHSFQRSQESPLTRRETEILEQVADGKTRSRIASEMFIDLETVKSHLKNIYSKLDVHSRADAIKTARQNKYI
ncbi:response regulator transcription factor [Taibaiella lutea]|uniref:Response regulator transcription factor n=1 Tax=Taibaiella lutea TaxID=2608001 RepID=A0A5M6CJB9_9BACT|nr:response regulator transcription factor [Taibaiella lutea]KAA5533455.1 response regulator transcription factor [Taibaiella lutea]